MTGLVLKLQPNEKFLINGVVLQNGERATKLRVRTRDVALLREKDALKPEEANTPLKRVYYIAQLALAGEADRAEAQRQITTGLSALSTVFGGETSAAIARAQNAAQSAKFHVVMRTVRSLFAVEQALLRPAAPR